MARDQIDMTPIETRDELVAWFEAGCKPKAQFRVGTEHEKFVFTLDGHRPVPYEGRAASARCSTACSACSAGSRSWRARTSSAWST